MIAREQIARISNVLRVAEVEVALLSSTCSVGYASGFWPSWEMWPGYNPYVPDVPMCIVWADGRSRLLLPSYYAGYQGEAVIDTQLYTTYDYLRPPEPTSALSEAIAESLGSLRRVAYEPHSFSQALLGGVERRIGSLSLVDVEGLLELDRRIKLPSELRAIRRASTVADLVQETARTFARDGMTELEIATAAIDAAWASQGERFAILLQLVGGPITGSSPVGEPSARQVFNGEIVCVDVAPWVGGYWSDTANGFVVGGNPDARQRDIHALVAEALATGIDAVKPGVTGAELDRLCRGVISKAGFDYVHHTGHGLGTSHTEGPRITPDSADILEAGMVIALEPGIYVDGWGGFRHEHVIEVTDGGAEVITAFEHQL